MDYCVRCEEKGMEYKIIKEELNLVFEVEKSMTEEDIKNKGLEKLRDGFVLGCIKEESECHEYLASMYPILKEGDDKGFFLSKETHLKIKDEDEAYDFVSSLFIPNFKVGNCGLSQIHFFTDLKNITYSVTLDYDFSVDLKILISKFFKDITMCDKYLDDFKIILMEIIKGGSENAGPR